MHFGSVSALSAAKERERLSTKAVNAQQHKLQFWGNAARKYIPRLGKQISKASMHAGYANLVSTTALHYGRKRGCKRR